MPHKVFEHQSSYVQSTMYYQCPCGFTVPLLFVYLQLLQRDPGERLGCIEDREKIRAHAFFREIDFVKLEARKLKPPFKPNVVRVHWVLAAMYNTASVSKGKQYNYIHFHITVPLS